MAKRRAPFISLSGPIGDIAWHAVREGQDARLRIGARIVVPPFPFISGNAAILFRQGLHPRTSALARSQQLASRRVLPRRHRRAVAEDHDRLHTWGYR